MITFFPQKNMRHGGAKRAGEKGFTLIETLVAITILMLAISGPLVFISGALEQANYAKDQVTAFYLAQDAVEQIRNIRDTNAIQLRDGTTGPGSWITNSNNNLDLSNCSDGNTCVISAANAGMSKMVRCQSANTCPSLDYDPTSFIYGYTSSSGFGTLSDNAIPSIYTRTVQVTEVVPSVEAQIAVTVKWKTQFQDRSFTVLEDIFNWAQ